MVLPPAARGIYVWPYDWAVKKGDFDKALAIPGVDGVGVHLTWSEISPAVKKYDFTAMDRQLAVARSRHLAVGSRSRRAMAFRIGCTCRLRPV